MNVLLFGATGMVGQGALRECLLDPGVGRVVAVGRRATGQQHEKLRDLVVRDIGDLSAVEGQLAGFDTCIFAVGVTSAGMDEADYTRLTYDLTLAVAGTLARLNPAMTFIYVSGTGADSSEQGRVMWARVRGKTENALMKMPFEAVYIFRPAVIIALHGITSSTRMYRVLYAVLRPLLPVLKRVIPSKVTTTEQMGRALLAVARRGYPTPILESRDIIVVATGAG
ncbi:NAD-dependent epimerase/dehydratase family protein [Longimicrobium sp.]|uniref:NAD-dependent epimerase/dehydratase family protein n=1 Tax=Longimicrobium sp. TaxID=2029185 RepID=UPI002BA2ED53|nr:NAD-dependent epimerase/dehydratase family protein [Longimicrobium sp.]HSU14338.1 NAD-dependent epimerase/dehydratase family protein [Longimicrobium sp.]